VTRLLTTRQVAEYVGLSPETILRRYRSGELVGIRLASNVLRFREEEVEAWIGGVVRIPIDGPHVEAGREHP
jgi:excisionase family DNA binding protein